MQSISTTRNKNGMSSTTRAMEAVTIYLSPRRFLLSLPLAMFIFLKYPSVSPKIYDHLYRSLRFVVRHFMTKYTKPSHSIAMKR
mmetsp:Transcript_18837/g.47336  ORF Transcript_18837/g.47336 Transcript_18837/m.47336 type:complete len:84 (-) Transcript_18837:1815-2066(-)